MSAMDVPGGLTHLPRDRHHRPVPWFVHIDDQGVPDFRVIRSRGIEDAYRFQNCWVCGRPRGRHAAFVIGPMCAVNRVSAEPPSHLRCARFSAQACPFLATPRIVRRERGLPEDRIDPAGFSIDRNPGVALVWSSRTWKPFRASHGGQGVLFDVGDPTDVSWWCEGRPATRDEVLASIDSGLPTLREQAEADPRRDLALAELERQHARRAHAGARMSAELAEVAVRIDLDTELAETPTRAIFALTIRHPFATVGGLVTDTGPCDGCGGTIGNLPNLAGRSLADDGESPPHVPEGWWELLTAAPVGLDDVDDEPVDAVIVQHGVARCRWWRAEADRRP